MTFCIFTIIKNEHQYLNEWIKYHLEIGIDHIFIFEDINSSSHSNITNEYPSEKVSLHSVSILPIDENLKQLSTWKEIRQSKYFNEGLWWIYNNYKYDWCFAIDNDEYITISDTLQSVMNLYLDYDAVILQWQNYNANGHIYKPDYGQRGIVDTYTQKCGKSINDAQWKSTKLVYNFKNYKKYHYLGSHLCCTLCKWCKTDFSKELNKVCYDNIYLRHYITKSWEEYVWKLKVRGMFHAEHRNYNEFFEMNPDMINKKEELLQIADKITNK